MTSHDETTKRSEPDVATPEKDRKKASLGTRIKTYYDDNPGTIGVGLMLGAVVLLMLGFMLDGGGTIVLG